jgi:hypothetical protein
LVYGSPPSKSIFGLGLPAPPGEDEPAVKCSRSAFAATAGLDSEGISHVFDGIAKTNILLGDEPWKAHAVRMEFVLLRIVATCPFLVHGLYLLII